MFKSSWKTGIDIICSLGFCFVLLLACQTKEDKTHLQDRIIGVKIYDHQGELSPLFSQWKELGINTVFSSISMYSNHEFRTLAKKNNITTFIIIPIFFDPEALQENPNLYSITNQGKKAKDDWVTFVCPSREKFRKQKIESVRKLIRDLDPDGLSIDFIRYFVFWEKVYPETNFDSIQNTCFDSVCLNNFQKKTRTTIPDSTTTPDEIADWIKSNHFTEWTQWKCELITSMIRDITQEARKLKPEIAINVHIVPWRQNDFNGAIKSVVGQDVSEIAKYVDYLSPMTYAHMVKREPSWIHSVVQDIYQQTESKIIPSIQVKEAYLGDTLFIEEFKESLTEALKPPSHGVIFWAWEMLEQYPQKKDVIQAISVISSSLYPQNTRFAFYRNIHPLVNRQR